MDHSTRFFFAIGIAMLIPGIISGALFLFIRYRMKLDIYDNWCVCISAFSVAFLGIGSIFLLWAYDTATGKRSGFTHWQEVQ